MTQSARPSHLVLVTHQAGLESYSAHNDKESAAAMFEWLEGLLAGTQKKIHMLEVPEIEGVVKCGIPAPPAPPAQFKLVKNKPANSEAPRAPLSQAAFEEETRQMLEGEGDLIARDVDDPQDDQGARS